MERPRSAKLSELCVGFASIRMIRLVTPPDMNKTRMFDLTAGEDEFLGMIQEVEDESYAVEEIGKATAVAMDLQDDNFETEDETYQVRRRHFSVA